MKTKDDILLEQAYLKILLKEEETKPSREISKDDIDKVINICKGDGITPKDFGHSSEYGGKLQNYSQLYNLNTQEEIEEYLVEYLVGFGLIKLSPGERLTYKGFDVTNYYEDAYFRYFEDSSDEMDGMDGMVKKAEEHNELRKGLSDRGHHGW